MKRARARAKKEKEVVSVEEVEKVVKGKEEERKAGGHLVSRTIRDLARTRTARYDATRSFPDVIVLP